MPVLSALQAFLSYLPVIQHSLWHPPLSQISLNANTLGSNGKESVLNLVIAEIKQERVDSSLPFQS